VGVGLSRFRGTEGSLGSDGGARSGREPFDGLKSRGVYAAGALPQ